MRWYVTGAKNYVYSQNIKQIRIASATIVTIKKLLTPFQFYRFEENLSVADRLANMMDLSNYNIVTQSYQNTSSDGTAGGYDGNINLDGDGNYLGNDSNNSELDADGNEIGTPDIC